MLADIKGPIWIFFGGANSFSHDSDARSLSKKKLRRRT